MQSRLSLQEDKTLNEREHSADKCRRQAFEHTALHQEVRELKQQISYFKVQLDSRDGESEILRKDLAILQGAKEDLERKNAVISASLKSR